MNDQRDERLQEILLEYVESAQAGKAPDRGTFLAAHPEFAADIVEFFASYDQLNRMAAPLRQEAASPRRPEPGIRPSLLTVGGPRQRDVTEGSRTAATAETTPTEVGQLGDYRLLREIGRGGMGVVYEAEQISLHRRVALKMLPFAAALDARQLQRFRNEAEAAAHLHHSNIVPVFAVGAERGVHYYAMQYIEGQSLADLIDELRARQQARQEAASAPKSSEQVWNPDSYAAAVTTQAADKIAER